VPPIVHVTLIAQIGKWVTPRPRPTLTDCCPVPVMLVPELIKYQIPSAQSPIGRVVALFQLTGVAVMLFGLGVWYLAELEKPGLLSRFHFSHFFLLALTYSLYFVIFAVISFREELSPTAGMAVSAVLSLPLLALHVARFTNWRFTMTRMLPLAVFTLGLVISGVVVRLVRVNSGTGREAPGGTTRIVEALPQVRAASSHGKAAEKPVSGQLASG